MVRDSASHLAPKQLFGLNMLRLLAGHYSQSYSQMPAARLGSLPVGGNNMSIHVHLEFGSVEEMVDYLGDRPLMGTVIEEIDDERGIEDTPRDDADDSPCEA